MSGALCQASNFLYMQLRRPFRRFSKECLKMLRPYLSGHKLFNESADFHLIIRDVNWLQHIDPRNTLLETRRGQ